VVQHPIKNGAGDDLVTGDLLPVREGLVGGHDHGALLVPARDELEEEVRAQPVDRDVTEHKKRQGNPCLFLCSMELAETLNPPCPHTLQPHH